MNFHNQFAKNLEAIRRPKPEAHFLIDDISKKILTGQKISEVDRDILSGIFAELQDLDKNLVSYMNELRSSGTISSEEVGVITSYFLVSRQIGPESSSLRNEFYNSEIMLKDLEKISKQISMPENSRTILVSAYKKIFDSKLS